jgi:peptidoglycan/LPS O-acetylase OafA/YrhL
VVIRHVKIRIPFQDVPLLDGMSEYLMSAIFVSGSEGVRIFFVVSGFLITLTSLNRWGSLEKIDIKMFYRFRFARIIPCLLGLLLVLSVLHFLNVKDYVINSKFSYFEVLFSALTFHLNWLEGVKGYLPGNWDVLWSLSVEEVFYLFFPLVCFVSKNKYTLSLMLLSLIVLGPFYRLSLHGDWIWLSKAYLSCMDSIAIGCLIALYTHKREFSKKILFSFNFLGALMIIFVLLFKNSSVIPFISNNYLYDSIISFGTGIILISSVRQNLYFEQLLYPITWYGRLSYEVYLTHMFVVYSGYRLYKSFGSPLHYAIAWLAGIIIVSGILGYFIERYFSSPLNLRLRNSKPGIRKNTK